MKSTLLNWVLLFSRILVGAVFIVSGMIKANDTIGFSYKLEEYFEEAALNLPSLNPYALYLGALASCGEIILGFAILFGAFGRLTTWLLMLLIVFFGWLTFYTAKCDPYGHYTIQQEKFAVTINNTEFTGPAEGRFIEYNGSALNIDKNNRVLIDGKEHTVTKKTVEIKKPVQCVTDCGCFGDALKGTIGRSLTPWESFYKDLILGVFVLVLFLFQKRITWNTTKQDIVLLLGATLVLIVFAGVFFQWWFPVIFSLVVFSIYIILKQFKRLFISKPIFIGIVVCCLCFGFAWYTYNYLPVKDFTPFAIGKNIPQQMKSAEELGLKPPREVQEYSLTDTITGKKYAIVDSVYLADSTYWNMRIDTTVNKGKISGYTPPIPAIKLTYYKNDTTEINLTDSIFSNKSKLVFLVMAYDLKKSNSAHWNKFNKVYEEAIKNGHLVYGITGSGNNDIAKIKNEYACKFMFINADAEGFIKPAVRSNPGLLVIKNGTIVAKYHYNNLPSYANIVNTIK